MNNKPYLGRVDLLIKAYSDSTINSRNYQAGEFISFINNAEMTISYTNDEKTSTKNSTLLSYTKTTPETVSFNVGIIKDGILELLGVKKSSGQINVPIYKSYETNDSGELYLSHSDIDELYIYDLNNNKLTGFTVDKTSGFVSGLTANVGVLCFYTIQKNFLYGYSVTGVDLPYVTVEAIGTLNVASTTRKFLVKFPRLALSMAPSLLFTENTFANSMINFRIIQNEEEPGVEFFIY
jgi:hypothetical protein